MGWIKSSRAEHSLPPSSGVSASKATKTNHEHIEHIDPLDLLKDSVETSPQQPKVLPITKSHKIRPLANVETQDSDLPFIPAEEVQSKSPRKYDTKPETDVWIVIDGIVYDCTDFVHEHPGGESVIRNFNASECSWQFWRFHSTRHLQEFGRALRIGRTAGVLNRYREVPQYIGLRSLDVTADW